MSPDPAVISMGRGVAHPESINKNIMRQRVFLMTTPLLENELRLV